jgi:uncharacterized membrane protein YcaP (DUF421 family)
MDRSLWSIDWHAIFVPSGSIPELVIRGSVMYVLLVAAFRIFRRDAGSLAVSDLLVVVLIADAAQNGMAGKYTSLSEGVILVATIFAWNFAFDWLGFRWSFFHRLFNPPSLLLVRDGRIQWRNMRAELLRREDLMEQLREQGVEDVHQVRRCFIEGDGKLSVIRFDRDSPSRQPRKLPG